MGYKEGDEGLQSYYVLKTNRRKEGPKNELKGGKGKAFKTQKRNTATR